MPGAQVIVRHRLGAEQVRIVTASGATVAVHRRAPEAIAGNPVRELDRIEQPKGQRKARPRRLTPD